MKLNRLAPYTPSSEIPWDEKRAAHLCRRAGFGAPRREVREVLERGPQQAVDRFLQSDPERDEELRQLFEMNRQGFVQFSEPEMLQAWWLYRMQRQPFPLREKMTLFWHGHFATSFHKVESMRLLHQQNQTLRAGALGDFRDLVLAVSRDPAMIVWLDNQENRKGAPNENYARELMELFTLGEGHYTERDVQEAARAFTGWHEREFTFFFDREEHDDGEKEFLGRRGNFDGADIVDIVLQQPQSKRFLARKLLRFFVMPEPDEPLVSEAAELLSDVNLEIKWFLRTLLVSRAFYSAEAYRTKIKSPVEYAVGAVRDLDAMFPGQQMAGLLRGMGQELFAPPSVKGWDGERAWISSGTWFARGAFAERLTTTDVIPDGFGVALPVDSHVRWTETSPERYVDYFLDRLVQNEVGTATRRRLLEFMTESDEGGEGDVREAFALEEEFRFQKVHALIRLILTLDEYHLC